MLVISQVAPGGSIMDIGSLVVGVLIGFLLNLGVDLLFYRRSPVYEKALDSAENRIVTLQDELAAARGGLLNVSAGGSGEEAALREAVAQRESRIAALEAEIVRMASLPMPVEPVVNSLDDDRLSQNERFQSEFRSALEDSSERQRRLELRLMDVETELANYRYPTLKAIPGPRKP